MNPINQLKIVTNSDLPCLYKEPTMSCTNDQLDINLHIIMLMCKMLQIEPKFAQAFGYGDTKEGIKRNDTIFGQLVQNLADISGPDVMYTDKAIEFGIIGSPPILGINNQIETLKKYLATTEKMGLFNNGLMTVILLVCCLFIVENIYSLSKSWVFRRKISQRVINVNYLLTGIMVNVIFNFFVGDLAISLYRQQEPNLPFNSIVELIDVVANDKWKIIVRPYSAYENSMIEWTKANQPHKLIGLQRNIIRASFEKYPSTDNLVDLLHEIPQSVVVISSFDYIRNWIHRTEIVTIFDESLGSIPAGFVYRKGIAGEHRINYYQAGVLRRELTRIENTMTTKYRIQNLKQYLSRNVNSSLALSATESGSDDNVGKYSQFSPLIIGTLAGVMLLAIEFGYRKILKLYYSTQYDIYERVNSFR